MTKHSTFRDSSRQEILQSLEVARKELSENRLRIRTQKIKTHSAIRKNRKEIARMLTALRSQQQQPATQSATEKEAQNG